MNSRKLLAAKILKTSPRKVRFADGALEEIKKAITRSDIRGLIAVKKIFKAPANWQSRARARQTAAQKRKGRQGGRGSRKGSKYSIVSRKRSWITKVRTQRRLLQELKQKSLLSPENYKLLYARCKGGYFRSRRHIKLYLTEHKLFNIK
ncbi:50S ribosomal protein L19e [Candidatus Woesearchaeota archaeon]|nr:50S ribosomal protein L19e [Candidatus Woesearchaeota archaeon]